LIGVIGVVIYIFWRQSRGKIVIIPNSALKNIKKLEKEGHFAEIYLGEYFKTKIVIKKLKDPSKMNEFFREAKLLAKLKHPNIINMLGIIKDENGSGMVVEYYAHGDLQSYLKNQADTLDNKILTTMCENIASGLQYMHSQSVVHCDLAARNILVGADNQVKITDFGMSREIKSSYKVEGSELPYRWCAPEVLQHRTFMFESDIWSFGIVMWEVFSHGQYPYYSLQSNDDVIKYVLGGEKLAQGENCPTDIYRLMTSCWKMQPEERIPLNKIIADIGEMISAESEKEYLEEQDDNSYDSYVLDVKEPLISKQGKSTRNKPFN